MATKLTDLPTKSCDQGMVLTTSSGSVAWADLTDLAERNMARLESLVKATPEARLMGKKAKMIVIDDPCLDRINRRRKLLLLT